MLTAHELIGFMSPSLSAELFQQVFENDRPLYKATLAAVAHARRVRPLFLERQPRVQRHQDMVATLSRPSLEEAAATVLRGWLMKQHLGLLKDFLDALKITHKDGVVEDLPETMTDDVLKAAVETVLAKHPPEVVTVYLHAFNTMNDTRWENLDKLLQDDARLQLGG
jgi:hypothetical protein